MDIENIVRKYLLEEFAENGYHEGISNDESLIEADIIDSLGILKMISFLEEKFGITFNQDEIDAKNFESIAAIKKFLKKKL